MMIKLNERVATVFIVDNRPDDYAGSCGQSTVHGLSLRFFKNGRAAMLADPGVGPDLWVVNMKLTDMSGHDLLDLLRWRYPGVPVVLVSDDGNQQDEIEARSRGVEMYLSKPLRNEWIASAAAIYA